MMGVDSYNYDSQYEYHRRQRLHIHMPPICINWRTCAGQRKFYAECSKISDDADYSATWGSWDEKEERTQQGLWNNWESQARKETQSADSASF